MFWSWFKTPAHILVYASFWLLLAFAMALRSVASHALIGDNLAYTQALTLALATCLLWAALLPQIIQWSGHISGGFPSLRSLTTHAGLVVGFVLVSVGWRFALDVSIPSLRRVQGTPSTVLGIYFFTGLGRSLLVYFGAVGAAHAWSRYRVAVQVSESGRKTLSQTPPVSAKVDHATRFMAKRFQIKLNGRIFFVPLEEIDWIEAAGNYVSLHVGDKSHLLRESMRGIEEQLDPARFLRVHRSAIVHINRVREVQTFSSGRHQAIFISGASANLGRSGIERLKPALEQLTHTSSR